jgi:LacI family transcriptional regulator/LacI family repressor for deo operon, udp, cdd, tsx, nupC, and nupG
MSRPTIGDVAEKAGFSKATVSAVLNDADTVKDSTRRKVNRAIDELNYRPRAAAQNGFQADLNKSIGLIIKESANPYFADVIAGARSRGNEKGYTILSASSEGDYDSEQEIVDVFKNKDVDGLVIIPVLKSDTDLSYLFELKRRNFPFVLLEEVQGVQASLVDIDNEGASKMAARHLLDNGHERIVHFAGPEYSMHSRERVRGIRRAFSESPLVFSDDLIVQAGAHLSDGYQTGKNYFADLPADERPTGVICYNDLVAIGLMRALRELRIDVPGDVAVIGCDDIELAQYLSTSLTSIRIPKFQMGYRGVDILIDQIESGQTHKQEKIHLDAELVQRESTRS